MSRLEDDLSFISVDWPRVLDDFKEKGMTYFSVSRELGVGWSTLQKWRTGSEPGWGKGTAILRLHARVCGPELTKKRVDEAYLLTLQG